MDNFMKKELESTRDYAVQAISNALQLREYNYDAATCIAYAYLDGVPSAETIFGESHLSLLDCYALMRNEEMFEDLWIKESRYACGESMAS